MHIASLCFNGLAGDLEFTFIQHRTWNLPGEQNDRPTPHGHFELQKMDSKRGVTPTVRIGFVLGGMLHALQDEGVTHAASAEVYYTNIVRAVGDYLAESMGPGWKAVFATFDNAPDFLSNYNEGDDPDFVKRHGYFVKRHGYREKFGFDFEYRVASAFGDLEIAEN